ncbi:ATP-binding protein [Streptomyces sp. NPDC004111]|uniref:ATP-binding protein n=1 Tax=Streptomyces sp. NPDC004111 TaxID=3364690 RepID=UPI0036B6011B
MRVPLPRGLRTRLVVAFLAVSALSALITALLTYREARSSILARSQNTAVHDLRAQLNSLAPDLPFPPSVQDLQNFTLQLDRAGGSRSWHTTAAYRDGPLVAASEARSPLRVPAALRTAVKDQDTSVRQRTDRDGTPWLMIGMPVHYAPEKGTTNKTSGLVVYADFSLDDDRTAIDSLAAAARSGAVPALALAVFAALLASRRVLRPVRGLHHGAEKLSAGALDTRLPVTGHDELADLTRTFNTMATTLEENDAELRRMEATSRRFAADVAHELRTPLAAMAAVTEVLDEDAHSGLLPPDTADAVLLISSETRKLARMVEDLMEVSRFDAGAALTQFDDVDLGTLVEKTLALRGWPASPGQIRVDVPAGLRVRVDPRRIDVVLANLIGNALHHGSPPVVLRARPDAPTDTADGPSHAVVTVTDHGSGIPEAALPHVFERFYKADSARPRSEGSGLGLAITVENVRLHGSRLTVANPADGGAEFTFTLPLSVLNTGEPGDLSEPGDPEEPGRFEGTER